MDKRKLLAVTRGEIKASLVIKNAKIVNVFTKEIEVGDLAVFGDRIVGIGDYHGEVEIDYSGYYIAPGLIDGHVHIESSMLTPNNYSLAVMPRGTTSVIADCHEIANVCGKDGIDFMLEASLSTPLDVFMMIPSCVPSTEFETAGARLTAKDIEGYKSKDFVLGLGEMMDYQGVINGKEDVLAKLDSYRDLIVDGHAPGLIDKELDAYVLSQVKTDHECSEPFELIQKVKRGMYIHLREGSQTKNVLDLLPGINPSYYQRILLCSDDLHPSDIENVGHIDNNINILIKGGIDPIIAISMGTINIANCYNIRNIGAIAPGYKADFILFKDISDIQVEDVYKSGQLVVRNKIAQFEPKKINVDKVIDTVKLDFNKIDLDFRLKSNKVNIITLVKNNIITKKVVQEVNLNKGVFLPSENEDLLKLCVIERHHFTGNIGKGIVKGYGLKHGAVAMTIAHDSHNLICLGDNDEDMYLAIKTIKDIGGGIVLASKGKVLESLALEVGGLMSLKNKEHVVEKLASLDKHARNLGVNMDIEDPFMQLAFLSLAVVPDIKVTDKGLFDVNKFKIISLEAGVKE